MSEILRHIFKLLVWVGLCYLTATNLKQVIYWIRVGDDGPALWWALFVTILWMTSLLTISLSDYFERLEREIHKTLRRY